MTYDPSTDFDGARANVAGAERNLDCARRILQEAIDREAEIATKPDVQPWEADAVRTSIEMRRKLVAAHERLLNHHRGVLDAMTVGA